MEVPNTPLYANVLVSMYKCFGSTRSSFRSQVALLGIPSLCNWGDPDENGCPKPLVHQISLQFTVNKQPIPENEIGTCIQVNLVDAVREIEARTNGKIRPQIIQNENGSYSLRHQCSQTNEYTQDDEINGRFEIHPALVTHITDEHPRILGKPDPRWKPEYCNRIPLYVQKYLLTYNIPHDINTYEVAAFCAFTRRWHRELKEREMEMHTPFTFALWCSTYYDRFVTYCHQTDPTTSLYAKVMISPSSIDPRCITDYAMEIECDRVGATVEFFNESSYDASGPREVQTSPHTSIEEMIGQVMTWQYFQHGEGIRDNGSKMGCGSHLHIRPASNTESISWHVYRALSGFFAPFFAGTPVDSTSDFKFRDSTSRFARMPDKIASQKILRWSDETSGFCKEWWLAPHTLASHRQRKPMTFEFRLNESIPNAAFTAVRIMGRIADAFIDVGLRPVWSPELLNLGNRIIPLHQLTKIDEIDVVLTEDEITADILAKSLNMPIRANVSYSLRYILSSIIFTMPMAPWERFWVFNICKGVTWSTIIPSVSNDADDAHIRDGILLTRKFEQFFPSEYNVDPTALQTHNHYSSSNAIAAASFNFTEKTSQYRLAKDTFQYDNPDRHQSPSSPTRRPLRQARRMNE